MSLIASYISGISLLGIPAEIYTYGTQYWMSIISKGFVSLTIALGYLPVFYTLQITSSYEYLNLRFNNTVRMLGSILFLTKMMLYIPIVIYVPALAFSQVTGFNLHLITPIVCVVCIFYTTLGGLKAVVWTDTVQTIVMFGGLIIVVVVGTMNVGGLSVIYERNLQSDRFEFFNMNLDPTIRHTFWTVSIGNYFAWLAACSVNQAMVQRCLSMPSLKSAYVTLVILLFGLLALVSMSCYAGLLIFATYYDCDPVTTKQISKSDQLLPYFVMRIASGIPGLSGMFISGVFSAALSSMSTGLNSMTGVIYEDLIKPRCKTPMSEGKASFIMKIIVFIIGCVCVGLVFVVEKLGMLIQASVSMASITAGPLLGLFTLGMFIPAANAIGALVGGITGLSLVTWMSIGTQVYMANGAISFPQKVVSVSGCSENWSLNNTYAPSTYSEPIETPFFLYQISYMYYTPIGALTVLIVGMSVSFITGCNKNKVLDKNLFSPLIHRFIRENKKSNIKDTKMEMQ
ncbi:brother of rumpel [Carabus blaptoides fortunei]